MGTKLEEILKAEKEADQEIINTLEKKVYDMKNLIEIAISLSSNLEFKSLVDAILYSCIGQLFLEKIAILLQVDIDVNSYYIHSQKGYDKALITPDVILDESCPLVMFLKENPHPHQVDTLRANQELAADLDKLGFLEPALIVPMKSKESLNGMLVLAAKLTQESFEESEKEFISQLARFSATAVENSRLYLMATHDRMTRLYIHNFFQERLLEEVARADRQGCPLSILLTDIDHFKKFNDTYGHQQGDLVLKEAAQLLKKSVREVDFPARYGGEEFAVILPNTDIKEALQVAERYRRDVEEHEFSGQNKPLHVTISIGVAQYDPQIDTDKKVLIERADKAMYHAKRSGRNRTCVYSPEI